MRMKPPKKIGGFRFFRRIFLQIKDRRNRRDVSEMEENEMNGLLEKVMENVMFVLEFAGIVLAIFLIALFLERLAQKKQGIKEKVFTTRKMAMIGMFAAIAMILHIFDFPLWFIPGFYKLDFSELPILIGTFAFGPAAGVMMEAIKILLKLCVKGTSTAFVGDLANFVIGCSFILPASVIYTFRKTKKSAMVGCITGTIVMIVFGIFFNYKYLIPTFTAFMPLDKILADGMELNPLMVKNDLLSFTIACVGPLNLIKGMAASIVTLLVYKPLSPIIKTGHKA